MKQEGPRALEYVPESWYMRFWPVANEISV